MATVDDPTLLRTMFYLWERMKLVVEPTGALGAAAALEGTTPIRGLRVGVILSGGNVDLTPGRRMDPVQMRRSSFAVPRSVVRVIRRSWFVRSRLSSYASFIAPPAAQQEFAARAAAPVTFLQINDVYTTVPIDGLGGLARVATLKQNIAKAGRTPFLVLAGDFLSPSVASSVFKGEHMIAALNAAGLDLATLGNHEFDFGDDVLIQRMHEATFQWVVSNVVDTNTGQPIGGAAPYVVKTVRRAEGRLHRPVPEHAGDHRRQAETHARSRSADRRRPLPADAEAGRRQRHRRRHPPGLRRRPRAGRAVSRDRPGDRRPRALPDHRGRAPLAHQQGRLGRQVRRAHRRQSAASPARSSASTSCCRSPARLPTIRRPPPSSPRSNRG